MAEYDLHSHVKVVNVVGPAALAATTNGAEVDMQQDNGYESIEYVVHVGTAFVGGGFDVTLEEDDTTGFPAPTAVPAAETLGELSSTIAVQVAIGDTDKVYRVGSIGKKRFQRCVLTETGTITAGVIGVSAVLSNPRSKPVAAQNT